MKKMSVIITTHSGSATVERAVDSVIQQGYGSIELIVVDDNGKGTDEQIKTEAALKKYIESKQLKYVAHDTNKNGSAARNTGFTLSTGEYIGFLDDDDVYLNNKIEASVDLLEKLGPEYGAVYTDVIISYADRGRYVLKYKKEGTLFYEMLLHIIFANPSVWIMRREAVEKINGFDDTFKRHQDFEFNARLTYHYKVGHVREVGSLYNAGVRRHYDPSLAKKYRTYYLEKMEDIIRTLSPIKQNTVYARNAIELVGFGLKKYRTVVLLTDEWGHRIDFLAFFMATLITIRERLQYKLSKEKQVQQYVD